MTRSVSFLFSLFLSLHLFFFLPLSLPTISDGKFHGPPGFSLYDRSQSLPQMRQSGREVGQCSSSEPTCLLTFRRAEVLRRQCGMLSLVIWPLQTPLFWRMEAAGAVVGTRNHPAVTVVSFREQVVVRMFASHGGALLVHLGARARLWKSRTCDSGLTRVTAIRLRTPDVGLGNLDERQRPGHGTTYARIPSTHTRHRVQIRGGGRRGREGKIIRQHLVRRPAR